MTIPYRTTWHLYFVCLDFINYKSLHVNEYQMQQFTQYHQDSNEKMLVETKTDNRNHTQT